MSLNGLLKIVSLLGVLLALERLQIRSDLQTRMPSNGSKSVKHQEDTRAAIQRSSSLIAVRPRHDKPTYAGLHGAVQLIFRFVALGRVTSCVAWHTLIV